MQHITKVSLSPYLDPTFHQDVSAIIQRRSANPQDPRSVFLEGLNLSNSRNILDLGCGFGYMTQEAAKQSSPDAYVLGLDACPTNEIPFLTRTASTGRVSKFEHVEIDSTLPLESNSFDVVLCSYSLDSGKFSAFLTLGLTRLLSSFLFS